MHACRNIPLRLSAAGLIAGLGSIAEAGAAGPVPSAPDPLPVAAIELEVPVPASWLEVKPRPALGIGHPVDVGRLAGMRGGDDSHESIVVIDGTVDGNTADRIISGSNTISDSAFNNANGINTVIQNTGTNVLIQNGMVVNVNFTDAQP